MWKRLSRIAGLLAFVIATMAGPVMAQTKPVEPMPCHEMSMAGDHGATHEMPAKKTHGDCGSACQCPVSHCALGQLVLPFAGAQIVYVTSDRARLSTDQRLNFALSDDLLRPPRA
ncbi:hypothetical protein [Asticcacaulis sp. AND118]|uniref:hypothetical protein n=1 Tax=Asticcacaulis sp. AND118 TaxID=2840468 RepID=UPI001CFFBB56|nr:hypothetical protein [Asticcacaulis sp. AND118]UDF05266.1 hypothetical protein LH365_13715 [Asticcacaulis sp. AND118]